jgi:hypothetical protein
MVGVELLGLETRFLLGGRPDDTTTYIHAVPFPLLTCIFPLCTFLAVRSFARGLARSGREGSFRLLGGKEEVLTSPFPLLPP